MQKKIIYSLIGLTILLLVVNIIIQKLSQPEPEKIVKEDYAYQLDSLFLSALDAHGVLFEWISSKAIKNKKYDSLLHVYTVNLPEELPSALVLKDLNRMFVDNSKSKLVAEETKNHRETVIKIYSGDHLKLQAFLKRNNELFRIQPEIGFIIDCDVDPSKELIDKLAGYVTPMIIGFTPSRNFQQTLDVIESYRFPYAVIIKDNIAEERFSFDELVKKEDLKDVIKFYKTYFNSAEYFLIDPYSEVFNSSVFNYILSEFNKSGITLRRYNRFLNLTMIDAEEAKSMFRFYTAPKDSIETKIFYTNPANFEHLQKEIKARVKVGAKIKSF